MPISPSAQEVNDFHLNSDKDSSAQALHHTLGSNPSQASPGNHNHDGKNSLRIKVSDLDGYETINQNLPFNIDGGFAGSIFSGLIGGLDMGSASSVYGGVPHLDCGGVV